MTGALARTAAAIATRSEPTEDDVSRKREIRARRPLDEVSIAALQRSAGNAAVAAMLSAQRSATPTLLRCGTGGCACDGEAAGVARSPGASEARGETGLGATAPASAPPVLGEGAAGGEMPSGAAAGGAGRGPASPKPADDTAAVDLIALGLGDFADLAALVDPGVLRSYTADPNRQTAFRLAEGFGPLIANSWLCLSRTSPLFVAPLGLFRLIRLFYRWANYGQNDPRTEEALNEAFSSTFLPMALGTAACDCTPPWLVAQFYLRVGLHGEPDAAHHFQHYLDGTGTPIVEPIERIVSEDRLVKGTLERRIAAMDTPRGELENAIDSFAGYANPNWRHALGNIDVIEYEILDDVASCQANVAAGDGTAAVRITLWDPYEWHPDVGRPLPCLHSAMENMKLWGARDFMSEGEGIVRLALPAERIPPTTPQRQ